jgi:hypothetical protein
MGVVSFTPRPLYPQGKGPRYPLGPTAGHEAVEKRIISCYCRKSIIFKWSIGKVKPLLYFIKHHAMKTYGRMQVQLHH